MDHIKKNFQQFVRRYKIGQQLKATQIVQTAREVFGNNVKISAFKQGQLIIQIQDPGERLLIEKQASTYIKAINQKLGDDVIKRFGFRLNRD